VISWHAQYTRRGHRHEYLTMVRFISRSFFRSAHITAYTKTCRRSRPYTNSQLPAFLPHALKSDSRSHRRGNHWQWWMGWACARYRGEPKRRERLSHYSLFTPCQYSTLFNVQQTFLCYFDLFSLVLPSTPKPVSTPKRNLLKIHTKSSAFAQNGAFNTLAPLTLIAHGLAVNLLPKWHLLLLPPHSNGALARLKIIKYPSPQKIALIDGI